ncbi:MAG: hypothetical protein ABI843_14535 [Dokdonella sp.]
MPTTDARSRTGSANLGNLLALCVSLLALVIGAYQTHLMQGQARASVWPYLTIGTTYTNDADTDGFILQIDNFGIGPAKVGSVKLALDGKPLRSWEEVLDVLGVESVNYSTSSLSGDVIPPNLNRETTIGAIRVNEREAAKVFNDAKSRFSLEICYCSVYDECWISRWQRAGVEPVARCTAPEVPFEN